MNFDLVAPTIHNPKKKGVKVKNVPLKNLSALSYGSVDAKKNEAMLKLMQKSKRYKDVEVAFTHRILDKVNANQFFAVTFVFPNGDAYISYRGTDITMIGWKEDLLMTFNPSILSQKEAHEYFKCVIPYLEGNFYLGGHSKGGNLATYVSFKMGKKYEDRLIKSYSFDGPGFKDGIKQFDSYPRIKHKLVKYITYNDFVGMVFNNHESPFVVYSTGVLLGGHDPFYWKISSKEDSFKLMKDRSALSKKSERGLVAWMDEFDDEDKSLAVDALFRIFKRVHTVYDLLRYGIPDIATRNKILMQYEEEKRNRVKLILNKLILYQVKSITTSIDKDFKR